jgi:hypothetical protein
MRLKFGNFLNDPTEYDAAERYWATLFEDIASKTPNQKWEKWFDNVYANGQKILDGNPILSRLNTESRKGVRVIQDEPQDNDSHIGAWLDSYETIRELVISCVLSDKTEGIVKDLITAYIVNDLSDNEMQSLIDKFMDR